MTAHPAVSRGSRDTPTVPGQAAFREVLGRFPTGVAAVTGTTGGTPVGLAVNSFVSVSLTPALVSFCVAHTSVTWPALRAAGAVCVSVLGEDQRVVSQRMATSGVDKFDGVAWTPSPSGLPIIDGAVAWLECEIDAQHAAGDHDIIVARVRHLGSGAASGPLVFHRGRYGRLVSAGDP